MTSNQLQLRNIKESERHDVAVERETGRHNLRMEDLEQQARRLQEQGNVINKEHYERADEISRWHTQVLNEHYWRNDTIAQFEADTRRVLAGEQKRHDIETEAISRQINAINAAIAAETVKHNRITEDIQKDWNATRALTEDAIRQRELQTMSESMTRQSYLGAQIESEKSRKSLLDEQTRTQNSVRVSNYAGAFSDYARGTTSIVNAIGESRERRVNLLKTVTSFGKQ